MTNVPHTARNSILSKSEICMEIKDVFLSLKKDKRNRINPSVLDSTFNIGVL